MVAAAAVVAAALRTAFGLADNVNLDKARRLLWPIKAEVWAQDLVGRSDDPHRQRSAGVDGL